MPTKYWYKASNGSDNWGVSSNWYTGPGGTGTTTSVPGSGDDVILNAASGSGTLTIAVTANCRSLVMTGFTGNLIVNSTFNIYGGDGSVNNWALKLEPGRFSSSGVIIFLGNSTTQTYKIQNAGNAYGGTVHFGNNTGFWATYISTDPMKANIGIRLYNGRITFQGGTNSQSGPATSMTGIPDVSAKFITVGEYVNGTFGGLPTKSITASSMELFGSYTGGSALIQLSWGLDTGSQTSVAGGPTYLTLNIDRIFLTAPDGSGDNVIATGGNNFKDIYVFSGTTTNEAGTRYSTGGSFNNIYVNSSSPGIKFSSCTITGNLHFTGGTGNFNGASSFTITLLGNLILSSGIGLNGPNSILFSGTGNQTVTFNGNTNNYNSSFIVNKITGTFDFTDNARCTTLTLTNGTITPAVNLIATNININGGTFNSISNITVTNLNLNSGLFTQTTGTLTCATLTNSVNTTIPGTFLPTTIINNSGDLTISSSTLSVTTITCSGGTINITSPTLSTITTINLNGGTLIRSSSFNVTTLNFNGGNGGVITSIPNVNPTNLNLNTGTLTLTSNLNATNITTAIGTSFIQNSGTLTYTGTFTSRGTTNIFGTITGVTLTITSGNVNLDATSVVATTGNLNLSGGTLTTNSPNAILADAPNIGILLSSTGSLIINNDTTTRRVSVTGGTAFTIASGKTLTLTGALTVGTPTPNSGNIIFEIFNNPTITSFADSIIKFTNTTSGYATFAGNNLTYGTVWFSRGTSTGQNRITGSNTIATLIDDGIGAHELRFGDGWNGSIYTTGGTQTITTAFNVNGSGSNKRITLNSIAGTGATAFNLNYTGSGVIDCNFLDIRNSNGLPNTSPQTWNAYGSVTGGSPVTVTGWFIDNARYWIGDPLNPAASGNWSDTTKWSLTTGGSPSGDTPTSSISAIFDENSGTGAVTITSGAVCSRFYCPTFSGTFTGSNSLTAYSDIILGPSFSSFTNTLVSATASGKTSYFNTNYFNTINTNLACTISLAGAGSVILKSNLNTTSYVTHTGGTFNTKFGITSYDVTCAYYNNSGTTTLNMNNSTFTITSRRPSDGVSWDAANTSLTLNAGTSSIIFTDSTNNTLEFWGGSKTYNLVHFNRGSSTGTIRALAQAGTTGNTYNEFRDTGTEAHSIVWSTLPQTFNVFNVNGASNTKRITLNSQTTANYSFISINPGITFCNNINVNRNTATPLRKFYANVSNSTIGTNTTGWNNSGGGNLTLLGVG